MARAIPLDKVLVQGTDYRTDDREVWIIRKLGTNSTTIGTLHIDRKPTTQVSSIVAPLHQTTSNLLGPLSLGDQYNVVLPDTLVQWMGASGSRLRVIGTKLILDPQETVEAALKTRADQQYIDHLRVVESSYNHGVGNAWADGVENTVINLTPLTTEEYHFRYVVMASVDNVSGGVADGDWAVRFYLENAPLEYVFGLNIRHGIDVLSMPRPPAGTTEMTPFTLADYPIVVVGDRTLHVRVANVSGTAKSPTTGNAIIATVTAVVRYLKK